MDDRLPRFKTINKNIVLATLPYFLIVIKQFARDFQFTIEDQKVNMHPFLVLVFFNSTLG